MIELFINVAGSDALSSGIDVQGGRASCVHLCLRLCGARSELSLLNRNVQSCEVSPPDRSAFVQRAFGPYKSGTWSCGYPDMRIMRLFANAGSDGARNTPNLDLYGEIRGSSRRTRHAKGAIALCRYRELHQTRFG